MKGLQTKNVLIMIQEVIRKTGVDEDNRFLTKIEIKAGEITINIKEARKITSCLL